MFLGQPIAKGNTADVYLTEGRAVKVFHAGRSLGEAEYEAGKQRIAHSSGLSVPKILDVRLINGRAAIIMEYVTGPTLGTLIQEDPARTKEYLAHTADMQIAIHAKPAAGIESMKERLATRIERADVLEPSWRAALIKRLSALPMEGMLCHGDFHPFNLIQTGGGTVIIDWVDASCGSPSADIYRSHLLLSLYSADLADIYLHLYCEKTGMDVDDVFAWAPFVAAARLCEDASREGRDYLIGIVRRHV